MGALSINWIEIYVNCKIETQAATTMGCAASVHQEGRKNIPEVAIFVPSVRIPVQSQLQKPLKGLVPKHFVDTLASIRNKIVLVAEDTDGSAITELQGALDEYLSHLVVLTHKENGLEEVVEFKWKNLEDGKQEVCVSNSWYELLSIVHMMAMLTLMEANSVLGNDQTSSKGKIVSADSMRSAVDLLFKAAGQLEFACREVLLCIPPEIKTKFPPDLHEGVLEATSIQALGQVTEMQLALAVESKNATLPVKRRLACEQLTYFSQAYYSLSTCNKINGYGKKHLLFTKWKYLEAKAAAYYFHGLMTDLGTKPSSHISAVCCFVAAEDLLTKSKKACLTFCLATPVTRAPPPWGAMKHLNKKIPEMASRKSQMYANLLGKTKDLGVLPELPKFKLSLEANDFRIQITSNELSEWDNEGASHR